MAGSRTWVWVWLLAKRRRGGERLFGGSRTWVRALLLWRRVGERLFRVSRTWVWALLLWRRVGERLSRGSRIWVWVWLLWRRVGERLFRGSRIWVWVWLLWRRVGERLFRVSRTWVWVLLLAAWPGAAQTEAERLIEAGHWKRARVLVETGARQPSDQALRQFLLSQIHNAFGDRESPLPLAEKAVALDGKVAKYHRQVAEVTGVMALHAGLWQQLLLARRFKHEIETALALDGRDPQALRDLMEFYLQAPGIVGGDKDQARATAGRIARLDAVQGFAAQARLAEAGGQTGQMETMLRRAVAAGPGNYRARVALAAFLLAHANADEARTQAEEAIRADATRVDAYAVLAAARAQKGETGELETTLAAAERQVPDDLLPYYRAADTLLAESRDLTRAERYLQRYLAAEPEGNAPTLAEAQGILGKVREKLAAPNARRATPGPR